MRRLLAIVTSLFTAASLAVALPAAARPVDGPPADAAGVTGTGILPNFDSGEAAQSIRLQAGTFDPATGDPPAPPGMATVSAGELEPGAAQPHLVQVDDGRFASATAAIRAAGGSILSSVPEDTYIAWLTPAQAGEIETSDAIRWTGYLQPGWRVPVAAAGRPGLMELSGERSYRVYGLRDAPGVEDLAARLGGIDGVRILNDSGPVVDVRATSTQVPTIAQLPTVAWVAVVPTPKALNANSRWVNDTGLRDVNNTLTPERLTGVGQTAAVADTGINYFPDVNGEAQAAFRDCPAYPDDCKLADYTQASSGNSNKAITTIVDNDTDHRKMAAYFDLGGGGVNPPDPSAHGTHVSGSVAADYRANGVWDGNDGLAPAARLVMQQISTPSGGLGGLPADSYQLWRQAYRPRNPASVPESYDPADYDNYIATEDARTHNNSYGLIAPVIDDGSAMALDEFVWEHEDMSISVSAGNSGPMPGSIGSPSVAKNSLSSAASANGRQPMASIDTIASFSSHGPTGDGRIGPDVATPGQIVQSTKGGSEAGDHYLQGTSMSSPTLVGLATDLRQYFWDGYGPADGQGLAPGTEDSARRHNPSAALVKAGLVNGATRMRGWYTGDDGSDRAQDGQWPSYGQGFGLVNLDNSTYFDGDPLANFYHDVWRDDEDAFAVADSGSTRSYEIDVAEGQPLNVSLAWTDAPTGLPAGTPALVNNLDLLVVSPDGTVYAGNNFNSRNDGSVEVHQSQAGEGSRDDTNLVERVRRAEPMAGTWTVEVVATDVQEGPQGFALAANGAISGPGGPAFDGGQPPQTDVQGAPTIDPASIEVDEHSADTAEITFTTDEPTTATAVVDTGDETREFADVYTYAPDSAFVEHYRTGPVETSEAYAGRPVVSTRHEILVFGLEAGQTYDVELVATDLGDAEATATTTLHAPAEAFQPLAPDTGQLAESDTDALPSGIAPGSGWQTGTQLYGGVSGGSGLLGAFMFRLPADVQPDEITGAAIQLTSGHLITSLYSTTHHTTVDLLPESFEPNWGTQNYSEIHDAESAGRARPVSPERVGANVKQSFTLTGDALDALKSSLATVADGQRKAAFRLDGVTQASTDLPSWEFGFNRRSQGPETRPKLVLFTGGAGNDLAGRCDVQTPSPTVTDVEVGPGLEDGRRVVTWDTDVAADSLVVYREQDTDEWRQVGSRSYTTSHHVQIDGLDPEATYEFGVRSVACNGAAVTDDNDGAGYDLFLDEGTEGQAPTEFDEHAAYNFDDGLQGWEVTDEGEGNQGSGLATSNWQHNASGGSESDGAPEVMPYTSGSRSLLTAPEAVTFGDTPFKQIRFDAFVDLETDFDYLYLEYSTNGGQSWEQAASYTGHEASYTEKIVNLETAASRQMPVEAGDEVLIRFVLDSDQLLDSTTGNGSGVGVDDVVLRTGTNGDPGEPADPEHTVPPHPAPGAEVDGLDLASVATRAVPTDADREAGAGLPPHAPGQGVASDLVRRACPADKVADAGFGDIAGSVHRDAITCIAWPSVTTGVGDGDYAPVGDVTRAQMASFILRLAVESGSILPADAPDAFDDDDGSVHHEAINALAQLDIVAGVGDTDGDGSPEFDPGGRVSRAQMASFIANVAAHVTGRTPLAAPDAFGDDTDSVHHDAINALARADVVTGRAQTGSPDADTGGDVDTTERVYVTTESVSRAQMASFLARQLGVLVRDGQAFAGGARVGLDTYQPVAGDEVAGVVATNGRVESLTISGCGLDGQTPETGEDGTFTVTIPGDREAGNCTLEATVTTSRPAVGADERRQQTVVHRLALTVG